jgi:hypothetical protein
LDRSFARRFGLREAGSTSRSVLQNWHGAAVLGERPAPADVIEAAVSRKADPWPSFGAGSPFELQQPGSSLALSLLEPLLVLCSPPPEFAREVGEFEFIKASPVRAL